MDPFLEQAGVWLQVHTALIVAIQQHLAPLVRPAYHVAIEQRTYLNVAFVSRNGDPLVGKPDLLVIDRDPDRGEAAAPSGLYPGALVAELPMPEEVTERFLEIRDAASGDVVTVLELLSPANKVPGTGRREYQEKRNRVLASRTHLVEIDLIRRGEPLPMRLSNGSAGDYRIVISRSFWRPHAEVLAFGLRDPIPDFPVPLRRRDPEPAVPLNQLLHDLYDRAGYDLAVDYRRPLDPPLPSADLAWLDARLRSGR
jgi:hypothetical protein